MTAFSNGFDGLAGNSVSGGNSGSEQKGLSHWWGDEVDGFIADFSVFRTDKPFRGKLLRRSGSKFGTEDCQPENGLRLPECDIPILGEARLVFDHAAADAHFGASVFWSRRLAALGGEQAAIEF